MVKLIIAGGRNFNDYNRLECEVNEFIFDITTGNDVKIQIISGGAKGADFLGEKFAKENGFEVVSKKADWNKYGKAAGPIRNTEMAKIGTHLIAFWDGRSKGTKHMIQEAHKRGLKVSEIKYGTVQSELF